MEEKRHLRTLGGLSLHRGGPDGEVMLGSSKSLALLAYVALAPGREASRGHLASLLWPGDPQRARRSLRQALYYLSKRAGTELLRSEDGTLRVAEERLEVDAWAFDRALDAGELERAVEVYGGPFLEGFGGDAGRELESWAESRNERIWAGLKAACHELVTGALEAGEPDRAVRFAREYVEVNPLDEKARRMLIRAHLAAGDRVQAYRAYEAYRTLLREELDDEPAGALRERMEALRDEIFGGPGEPVAGSGTPAPAGSGGSGGSGGATAPVGEGADASPGAGGRTGPGADPSAGWRVAAVAGLAAIVAAAGALTLRGTGGDGAPAGWAGASGPLRMATAGKAGWMEVRVREGEVASTRTRDSWELVDPTGRRTATTVRAADGVDLAVLDRATGDTLARTREAADELPHDWSPDGRRVLFRAGEPVEGADGYRWRWEVLNVETGERRALGVTSHGSPFPRGDWSPRGTRVALEALGPEGWDVWVVDADGDRPRKVIDHPDDDRHPAWSPDGAWLVFSSDRGATRDLWLARPDGTGLERLTYGPRDEYAPAWLDDRHLVHAVGSPEAVGSGPDELRLMDLPTRRTRTLMTDVGLAWLHRADDGTLAGRRVAEVRIQGGDRVAGPGQRLWLRARITDADGREVPEAAAPLRWSSTDTSVARVGTDGRLRAAGSGETGVVASAGGWRADTVRISVREPEVRATPVVFSERWTEGLRADRWAAFGEPLPSVKRLRADDGRFAVPATVSGPRVGAGDPEPGAERPPSAAFVSNGDENYDSGAVTRRRFDLSSGLTVEFRARLPFSGRRYETLHLGLVEGAPVSGEPHVTLEGSRLEDLTVVKLSRVDAEPRIWVRGAGHERLPPLETPGAWHRYALQVEADGTVSWAVDGRIRWRSPEPLMADRPDYARVAVGGRSLHADLLVGPITVRRGVGWALE